jgi:hypothetical protein
MAQGEGRGSTIKTLVFIPISLFLFCSLPFFAPSFLFCPGTGKEEGRERQVGRKDVGVHKGDCQLQMPWHRWSSSWALSDVVRGLVNYVYLPPLLLAHHASNTNKGYRSRIHNGPPQGWGLLTAQGLKAKPTRWVRAA